MKNKIRTRSQKKAAEVVQSSRFDILNDDVDDMDSLISKLSHQEKLNDDLRNQVASMDSTILQMQKMLETMVLREQNSHSIPSPTFSPKHSEDASSSLLAATAKVLRDNNTVEKSPPFLDGVDAESWSIFSPKYLLYRNKMGSKFLRDCIAANTITYYQIQIDKDIMQMDCTSLFDTLNKLNKSSLEPTALLRTTLKMDKSTSYDKKKIQLYISSFLNLLNINHQLKLLVRLKLLWKYSTVNSIRLPYLKT